ncbi:MULTISPECIES: hypothetical protein [Xanthomonas]|uniref:hypothetical protein n=1 Tax=Xanthomonas TaxID=338 RepID=UPI001E545521|nr:hypothetical protein [Xanthomonas campestris]MCC5093127.1 hypothetical protein [Xanthomonas campestris pv. incanae]MDC8747888.1 hypothetical protein [Xanthomonas campestris]MEA9609191.1 hypothetical protein [Xanthomonas campestris pv. incanae]MEA9621503.1 hypothetical protein [Xanthomonas campestris pv. incanae]
MDNREGLQHMKSVKSGFNRLTLVTCVIASTLALLGTAQAAAAPEPSVEAAGTASDIYQPGQQWVVPGEWQFTINSARTAKVRIVDAGGGSWVPTYVLLLRYSYKNIGFDDSANFKGSSSTLGFSKAHFDVVDANDANNGGVGNYPVRIKLVEDTQGQKLGQQMLGAQWPYAFKKKPKTIKVTVAHYDSELKLHKATFIVPVQATAPTKQRPSKHAPHA